MSEFRADLHCHTTCSDGTVKPDDMILLAKKTGLSGLSITDHDTIEAYDSLLELAKKEDLMLLPGIEISTMHKETSVHVLAYAFSLQNEEMKRFCEIHKEKRKQRNSLILEKLSKKNMILNEDDILNSFSLYSGKKSNLIGRPHIALAMVQKGYVKDIQDAFRLYIGEGKACFVPGTYNSVEETIDLIHRVNGFAIIAHPHLVTVQSVLQDILKMPFDGIEAYYAKFSPAFEKRWVKLASKKNWMITGGSDFHGELKPLIPLGCSWVGKETFDILYQRYLSNNP